MYLDFFSKELFLNWLVPTLTGSYSWYHLLDIIRGFKLNIRGIQLDISNQIWLL